MYKAMLIYVLIISMGMVSCQFKAGGQSGNSLFQDSLQLLSEQFTFTEGPAADRAGNVYFTDQPNNKIWKYDLNGELTVFMDTAYRSNGMYFDQKDALISCADEHFQLLSISKNKAIDTLVSGYKGADFNGPNDVWAAPGGGYYFTDPYYQRDYWERQSPDPKIGGEYVYFLSEGKEEPVIVEKELKKPNGIVGTPDGKKLYVADIGANETYVYDVAEDGQLENKKLFTKTGVDGMTIDRDGNIYMAGQGVFVFNPDGEQIAHLEVPRSWTSNVCFYGKKRDHLFITATEAVYLIKTKTRGVK